MTHIKEVLLCGLAQRLGLTWRCDECSLRDAATRLNRERMAAAATRDERRKARIAKAAGLTVEEAVALGL